MEKKKRQRWTKAKFRVPPPKPPSQSKLERRPESVSAAADDISAIADICERGSLPRAAKRLRVICDWLRELPVSASTTQEP